MKILLLGGTGAMGSHLADILSKDNRNEIVITTRKERESRNNVSYRVSNAHNTEFLKELLITNWDVIVDFMVYNTQEFRSRVDMLLASCCLRYY